MEARPFLYFKSVIQPKSACATRTPMQSKDPYPLNGISRRPRAPTCCTGSSVSPHAALALIESIVQSARNIPAPLPPTVSDTC